jgi:hypothetical protein
MESGDGGILRASKRGHGNLSGNILNPETKRKASIKIMQNKNRRSCYDAYLSAAGMKLSRRIRTGLHRRGHEKPLQTNPFLASPECRGR